MAMCRSKRCTTGAGQKNRPGDPILLSQVGRSQIDHRRKGQNILVTTVFADMSRKIDHRRKGQKNPGAAMQLATATTLKSDHIDRIFFDPPVFSSK